MNTCKRLMALMLAVVMTVTMMAACGNKVEEPPVDDPNVTTPPVTSAPVTTPPVTVTEPVTTPPVTVTEPVTTPEVTTTTEATEKPVTTTTEDEDKYTVEDMSATMYATDSVNVRTGPSANYDKIGRFDKNEAVTVTGRASTGWFRVLYDGKTGYVSNAYLTDKEPSSVTTQKPSDDDEPDVVLGDDDDDEVNLDPTTPLDGFGDVISDNQLDYLISRISDPGYEIVIRQILEGIQNFQSVIYVDPYISAADAQDFQYQILPVIAVEYCYVEKLLGTTGGGVLDTVKVEYYSEDPEKCLAMVNELRNKTDKVLSKVKSSWSDYQKIKYIHDWIVTNSTADIDNIGGPWAPTAYGAIVDGRPTCLGYAKATFYMLSKLGFDCVFDVGLGTPARHIWVKVKADGDWYCVDTTWDDPVSSTKVDPSYVSYEFFMRTDEFMTNTRVDNFDMKFFDEPSATATRLNWYVVNDCYIESIGEAEGIIKQAIKKAVAGGDKYEYVRLYCSSVDVYDQVISKYSKSFASLLADQTSKYKLDKAWGGTQSDYPDIHKKCITFRIKK